MSVNCTTFVCQLLSTGFDADCRVYASDCNPCVLQNCSFTVGVQDDCLLWDCEAPWTTTTAASPTTTAAPGPPAPPSTAKGSVAVVLVVVALFFIVLLTVATAWASQAVRQTLRNGLDATATGLGRCWVCCSRQGDGAAAPQAFLGQFHGDGDEEPLVNAAAAQEQLDREALGLGPSWQERRQQHAQGRAAAGQWAGVDLHATSPPALIVEEDETESN
jgi:hypothetical protein